MYAYCDNNPVMYYDPSGHTQDFCGTETNKKQDDAGTGSVSGEGAASINPLNGLPENQGYDSFGDLKNAIG